MRNQITGKQLRGPLNEVQNTDASFTEEIKDAIEYGGPASIALRHWKQRSISNNLATHS